MDMGRAVSYIFEDRRWTDRVFPLLIVGALSLIPVFGLLATAVALGFMTQLARNVRDAKPRPLPKWDDWGQKFQIGGDVMLAILAYNLPTILIASCSTWLLNGLGNDFLGSTIGLFTLCCITPMLLFYTFFAWPLLATGFSEYLRSGQGSSFYHPIYLWNKMQDYGGKVTSWAFYAFLVNIVIILLLIIPVVGWTLILLFAYPVHGHLLGQLAQKMGN